MSAPKPSDLPRLLNAAREAPVIGRVASRETHGECTRQSLDPLRVRHRDADLRGQPERGAVANDYPLPQKLLTEPRWSVTEEEVGVGRLRHHPVAGQERRQLGPEDRDLL